MQYLHGHFVFIADDDDDGDGVPDSQGNLAFECELSLLILT